MHPLTSPTAVVSLPEAAKQGGLYVGVNVNGNGGGVGVGGPPPPQIGPVAVAAAVRASPTQEVSGAAGVGGDSVVMMEPSWVSGGVNHSVISDNQNHNNNTTTKNTTNQDTANVAVEGSLESLSNPLGPFRTMDPTLLNHLSSMTVTTEQQNNQPIKQQNTNLYSQRILTTDQFIILIQILILKKPHPPDTNTFVKIPALF